MIQFIKSNSNFFIFFLLIFFTVDTFIIILKIKDRFESIPNLKISYDALKSFYIKDENKLKYIILYLIIKNISSKPIEIDEKKIKITNDSKTYTSNYKDTIQNNNFTSHEIDIPLDNILTTTSISSYGTLNGYVFFEISDHNSDNTKYDIIIETHIKNHTFKKEIEIKELNNK